MGGNVSRVEKSQQSLDNQPFSIPNLPLDNQPFPILDLSNEIISKIFEMNPQNASVLDLVCKRFNEINSNASWSVIAMQKGYLKIVDHSWKESYYLLKILFKLVDQIYHPYWKINVLLEFVKLNPSDQIVNKIKKIIVENKQFMSNYPIKGFAASGDLIEMSATEDLLGVLINLKEIEKAKNFIDEIEASYYEQTKVQLEIIKNNPSDENIEKAFDLITKVELSFQKLLEDEDFFEDEKMKILKKIELLKDDFLKILFQLKKTEKLIDRVSSDPEVKARILIEIIKEGPSEENISKIEVLIEQISNLKSKIFIQLSLTEVFFSDDNIKKIKNLIELASNAYINVEYITDADINIHYIKYLFLQILIQQKEFDEAKKWLKQITDQCWRARAELKLLKVQQSKKNINKSYDVFCLNRLQLVRILIQQKKFEETKELIDQTDSWQIISAQLDLVETQSSDENIEKAKEILALLKWEGQSDRLRLVCILFRQKKYEKAKEIYEQLTNVMRDEAKAILVKSILHEFQDIKSLRDEIGNLEKNGFFYKIINS